MKKEKKVGFRPELTMEYTAYSVQLAREGRLADAVAEMRYQISQHPEQTYLNYWMGILLYDMHEYESACEAFRKELEITPRFRDAAWELGSVYSRMGRIAESIASYHLALDIDPCCVQALFGLGNAQLRFENFPEAIEYYKDILLLLPELDRSNPRAEEDSARSSLVNVYYQLGVAWMMMAQRGEAKEAFEMVQKLEQGDQLAKFARQYLELLSDPNFNLDSIKLSSMEFRSEDE